MNFVQIHGKSPSSKLVEESPTKSGTSLSDNLSQSFKVDQGPKETVKAVIIEMMRASGEQLVEDRQKSMSPKVQAKSIKDEIGSNKGSVAAYESVRLANIKSEINLVLRKKINSNVSAKSDSSSSSRKIVLTKTASYKEKDDSKRGSLDSIKED